MEHISIAIALALIPAASWLDRQRGTPKEHETIAKLPALIGLGLCNAFFVVDHGSATSVLIAQTLMVVAAVAAAYNWPGFGHAIGFAYTGHDDRKYAPWQFGLLKKNPWAALVFYGAVFFPVGLLLAWSMGVSIAYAAGVQAPTAAWMTSAAIKLAIAHAIAWPGACAIVRYWLKMPVNTEVKSAAAWGKQEDLRGALSMIVAAAIFFINHFFIA